MSINHELLEIIYDAASIRRWNDQINPVVFTELDKQAHKMIIAFVLAKIEEDNHPNSVNWLRLIEGAIIEMLHRIILTDIKPPVFHRMMEAKGPELNRWVLKGYEATVSGIPGGFYERMRQYLLDVNYSKREKRILKAAHYLATQWEFDILYKMCPFIHGINEIKEEIEDQIEDHYDLLGVQKIALKRKTAGFVDLCGQLRFQKRWSQSPRIPETSVLGHMLVVAIMTYLVLCENEVSESRKVNGFFGGLFHDLPEVLTRDITSPIKAAVEHLDEIIKQYEKLQMDEKLRPLIPSSWYEEISYYTEDEFDNRTRKDGKSTLGLTFEEMAEFDSKEFWPVDGEIIRCCDHLAAFIEASTSIKHGVTSRHLEEGVLRLREAYQKRVVGKVNFGEIFKWFDVELQKN